MRASPRYLTDNRADERMSELECYRHGVMLRIGAQGVLVTGAAGIGKSRLALALLSRGHTLIADDLVELDRQCRQLVARAAPGFGRYLMAGELGVVDIVATFGDQASSDQQRVDLIVQLCDHKPRPTSGDPLAGTWGSRELLGCTVPHISFHRAHDHQLPMLVECASRQLELRARGHDSAAAFRQLQRRLSGTPV